MRRSPISQTKKRLPETHRTDPKERDKPIAQVPKRAKIARKFTFVVMDGDGEYGTGPFLPPFMAEPKKRGPKPFYRGDILRFRDQLVIVLESYWPELQSVCGLPVKRGELLRVLSAIHIKAKAEPSDHLTRYFDSIVQLIVKNRVRNDPRQIANALAGLPDIKITTSQKICGSKKNRCQIVIGERALRAYVERKHPRLARLLLLVSSGQVSEYAQALRDYDLRDPNIYLGKNRPERLRMIWENGLPNWIALGLRKPTR